MCPSNPSSQGCSLTDPFQEFSRAQVLFPMCNGSEMRDPRTMMLDVVIRPFCPISGCSSTLIVIVILSINQYPTVLITRPPIFSQSFSAIQFMPNIDTSCSSHSDSVSRYRNILRNHPRILATSPALSSRSIQGQASHLWMHYWP